MSLGRDAFLSHADKKKEQEKKRRKSDKFDLRPDFMSMDMKKADALDERRRSRKKSKNKKKNGDKTNVRSSKFSKKGRKRIHLYISIKMTEDEIVSEEHGPLRLMPRSHSGLPLTILQALAFCLKTEELKFKPEQINSVSDFIGIFPDYDQEYLALLLQAGETSEPSDIRRKIMRCISHTPKKNPKS